MIQSTVADTAILALDRIVKYRKEHMLDFMLVNQIHDSIMVEAPEKDVDKIKEMFKYTMGNIEIPVGPPLGILTLGIDIEVMTRWGEKVA